MITQMGALSISSLKWLFEFLLQLDNRGLGEAVGVEKEATWVLRGACQVSRPATGRGTRPKKAEAQRGQSLTLGVGQSRWPEAEMARA